MVRVIHGNKGVGKTKMIIDMANESVDKCRGNIVFIDDDNRYMYDLKHQIRFINAGEFGEFDEEFFYGFITGVVASNYDIEVIYIDGFLRLVKANLQELGAFFNKLHQLSEKHKIEFVLSVSGDPAVAPDFLKPLILNTGKAS